ncbi:hypothetical protein DL96DRAFT_1629707 [Flagelloscypha sp. PMI_526]|nr:hypothetical protein DL96DRAFT_1629707 [Flagelloscypha sp. PMI_526]
MFLTGYTFLLILGLLSTVLSFPTSQREFANAEPRPGPLVKRQPSQKARAGHVSSISATFTSSFTGYIEIISTQNSFQGYLSKSGIVDFTDAAAQVTFLTASGSRQGLTCSDCGGKYLGLSPSSPSMSLSTTSTDKALLQLVDTGGGNNPSLAQYDVWTFNATTNDVSVYWNNVDGSSSSNQVLVQIPGSGIYVTANPTDALRANSSTPVLFKFVPTSLAESTIPRREVAHRKVGHGF